jgi:hypothetical protein
MRHSYERTKERLHTPPNPQDKERRANDGMRFGKETYS